MKAKAKKSAPLIKIILVGSNGSESLVAECAIDVLRAVTLEIDGQNHSIVSMPGRLKSVSEL